MGSLFPPFAKASCSLLSLLAFSLQLLLLFHAFLHSFALSSCLHHQKLALLQLKDGFSIHRGRYNSSSQLDTWNRTTDCCTWEGITCDAATGHVTGLDLSSSFSWSSWIGGRIDSSLFQLSSLQKLNLYWNVFKPNPIPSGLGQLSNLTHLNLSRCGFSGQIPFEISKLTMLVSLDLSDVYYGESRLQLKNPNLTTLVGNLSSLRELLLDYVNISESEEHGGKWAQALSTALPNLQRLSLRYCNLPGPIDTSLFRIPFLSQLSLDGNNILSIEVHEFLGDQSALTFLSLQSCDLHGKFSESIFLLPKLQTLDISDNPSLSIPNFVGDSSNLTFLSLRNCNLSGKFPESIFLLPKLNTLDISDNPLHTIHLSEFPQNSALRHFRMEGTNIHEKLLDSIENLKFLKDLSLKSCNLCGPLPSSIGNLTKLEDLDLSFNNFSGTIPSSYENLKFLKDLSLQNCNLSGPLPSSIVNLTQLEYLDLSSNNFSGTIPSSYGDELQNLTTLDLSYNSLEGLIPPSLFSHPSLKYLYLYNNQFSSWHLDFYNESSSVLEVIRLDNNKLHGPIPRLIFELKELGSLSLGSNNCTGTIGLHMFQNLKNLWYLDLSDNSLSFINDNGSSHLISSSQIQSLLLRSCNICEFPNYLQNLTQLYQLDLSNNKIHGKIPSWIWKLGNSSLRSLNLSNNFLESFEYPLPDFSSSYLGVLDLHSNRLQGSLPVLSHQLYFHDYSNNNFSSIMPANINFSSTRYFFFSGNKVCGEIPFSICHAKYLEALDLSNNNFSGNIPNCLGKIGSSLNILNLRKNSLQGNIPDIFQKECSLRTLNLYENTLEGPIPRSVANCKALEVLDLGNNRLNGIFPFWLETLSKLRILILRSNQFDGPIAHSRKSPLFPFLQIFDLSSNFFTGIVSPELFLNWKAMRGEDDSSSSLNNQIVKYSLGTGTDYMDSVTVTIKGIYIEVVKILTAMTSLDLSNNRFQGEILKSIGRLKLLIMLNFSQNEFRGPIPLSLGNLAELESLDLSRNRLSGEIPQQLLKLTFLEVLNLSQNLLVGSIPQGQQFSTFTNDSFLGNIGLCGRPLSIECGDHTQATPPSTLDRFGSDGVGDTDWKFMWIGFGVGFGVGFGFGVGVVFWALALWRKGSRKYMQLIDRMFFKFSSFFK